MNKRLVGVVALVLLLLCFGVSPVLAEQILDYKSEITVQTDAMMAVTETIVVYASGQQIRHGIYRDIPTGYKDTYGNWHKVDFEVVSVKSDGLPEHFLIERQSNGERIYIGHTDTLVKPGIHSYAITYLVGRQLGFFKYRDELYWNVTGNHWVFPIQKASAVVKLPAGVPLDQVKVDGFTGVYGSTAKDYTSSVDADDHIIFQTTRSLNPSEGMTIVVAWPKGYVTRPSWVKEICKHPLDNQAFSWFLGLLMITLYYLLVWFLRGRNPVGRDQTKGTVIPVFSPPEGLSPAAIRYIYKTDYDRKVLTCAIIHLAVKGALQIDKKLDYELLRKPLTPTGATPEEMAVYAYLPENKSLILNEDNTGTIRRMSDQCYKSLDKQFGERYFKENTPLRALGIYLSLGLGFGLIYRDLNGYTTSNEWAFFGGILLFIVLNVIFWFLLNSVTTVGHKLREKIQGFRMFLSTAERDRLNTLYPGGLTPRFFEELLPYALALDVEQEWAERFNDVLAQTGTGAGLVSYYPEWYHSSDWSNGHSADFLSDLGGDFSDTISSLAAPLGSGSGGGGFSGGGGGGGGGGGW